jgi:hypothetical protein
LENIFDIDLDFNVEHWGTPFLKFWISFFKYILPSFGNTKGTSAPVSMA